MSAADFTQMIGALDSTFVGFKFSAIVAPYDLNALECFPHQMSGNCATCDPCCGLDSALGIACVALPADQGSVYQELVTSTGGVEGNLCTQDFVPAFEDMAMSVINDASVACVYNIPDPGVDLTIDYDKVNVEYQATPASTAEVIPFLPGGESACGASGGWYYGAGTPPSQVLLCPTTCDAVQVSGEAKVTVKFGCDTLVL